MTTQTKFFESNNIWDLEREVNKFLKKLHWSKQVDVKYNHLSSHLPQNSNDDWNVLYTAMISYEPNYSEDSVLEGSPSLENSSQDKIQQGADPL
jgi:hypothetical protein